MMRKRWIALLLAITMLLGILPASALAGSALPFTDVKGSDWFYDGVRYVYENGLMGGTGDAAFSPNTATTRGMIVTILHRMEGEPAATGEAFADVAADRYYAAAVAWASVNKIVGGYGDGTFGPNDPITREQLAAILYRYAQFKGMDVSVGEDTNILSYTDFDRLSEWAIPAMQWACGAGLISGVGGGALDPQGQATRAQIATILMRFCDDTAIAADEKTETDKKTGIGEASEADEKTAADEYYESNSEVIDVIDAGKSGDALTEEEVKSFLEERGFDDYPITYEFSIDGEDVGETEVSDGATDKHPMYQTFYLSKNSEAWTIYVINGDIFAYPASFNLESDLGAELLVSESEAITCYHVETNRFYVTIPYATNAIVVAVDAIDAETLDTLCIEEICRLSGATPPVTDDEGDITAAENSFEASNGIVMAASFNDGIAMAASFDDGIALTAASTTRAADDPVIIVSLGDSYSSGEGIEPFYGQNKSLFEKVKDEDWLAHRSTLAWPSLLEIPGIAGRTGKYRGSTSSVCQWYFAAASGAETKHFNNQQKKDYRKRYSNGITLPNYLFGSQKLPTQLSVFETNDLKGKVDYVTLTIGGNDLGFTDIVTNCVLESSYVMSGLHLVSWLDYQMTTLWTEFYKTTKANLKQAYKNIETKAGKQAAIIVAGYPKLFDQDGKGFAISKDEATTVNTNVTKFNTQLHDIVNSLYNEGMNIYFVDVEAEFDTHEAYSDDAWINPVWFGAKSEDINDLAVASAYSVHPNASGARAYARCVNAKIAEIEKGKTISGMITIADTDTDMTNNVPLEGATVKITEKTVGFIARKRETTSDSSGAYALTGVLKGTYFITVSKEGYIPVTEIIAVEEDASEIVYNITIEAIPEAYSGNGCASGAIYDVGTGLPVSGLTLYIRAGLENTVGDVISTIRMDDGAVNYTTDELPAGNYTIQIVDERTDITEEERYITSAFNIKILGGMTIGNQNGYVSNSMTTDALRIVLTWGATPSDLDSHLVGPAADGGKFHVYYSNKTYGSYADLDVDDTSSYGPETITIHSFTEGVYTYAVHDYSNRSSSYSTAMANSGAQVKVYRGAELIATYNVPANMDGTLWTVFTYNSATKQITTVNTMSYDSSSGESLMSVSLADAYRSEPCNYEETVAILTQDISDTAEK